MTIAFVQEVGRSASTGTSGTTEVITISGVTTTVGNHIILTAVGGGAAPSSVADSQGNTWALDTGAPAASDPRSGIFSAKIATALVNADTITVTYAASLTSRIIIASEFSGLDATTWFDKQAISNGSGTSADSTATATTSQADELVMGMVGHVSTVSSFAFETLSPAWQVITSLASTGTVRTNRSGYRIVSATAAMATKATWTTSRAWSASVATYKAAAAGGATPYRHNATLVGVG